MQYINNSFIFQRIKWDDRFFMQNKSRLYSRYYNDIFALIIDIDN